MKVYELIQKLCANDPNAEVIIRVNGECMRLMEYIDDSRDSGFTYSTMWASVDKVEVYDWSSKVFIDCDLERL